MKKQIVDQTAHFMWSAAVLAPVLMLDSTVLGGALSGLVLALPREFVDQWPIGHWKDTLLDLAFFTMGGAFTGWLI